MLDSSTFKTVVDSTPLISIDLIARDGNKVLLGKRINKPAKGYYFTTGGRIYKNETIANGIIRIAKDELGISSSIDHNFIGVFEHFYDDSIFENVSTHYINMAYEIDFKSSNSLPCEQHSKYVWMSIDELLVHDEVHDNVKLYFKDKRNGRK
ncbi:NUDIX domain-containing protein [Sulfurimonas sp.]|uniref:GDP-mannose mannosyl hydrolase n=1 Tax=Sulfurimonas sp. TaxID=2022749 RepID=UPI0025E419C3|nr:NUDIX domain-containing protein [Sulfurimonas sp.]MBT5934313.1 NUDIX domain-containing protein [Sulfurimonas sp.]